MIRTLLIGLATFAIGGASLAEAGDTGAPPPQTTKAKTAKQSKKTTKASKTKDAKPAAGASQPFGIKNMGWGTGN